jgi:hypothetical protein
MMGKHESANLVKRYERLLSAESRCKDGRKDYFSAHSIIQSNSTELLCEVASGNITHADAGDFARKLINKRALNRYDRLLDIQSAIEDIRGELACSIFWKPGCTCSTCRVDNERFSITTNNLETP